MISSDNRNHTNELYSLHAVQNGSEIQSELNGNRDLMLAILVSDPPQSVCADYLISASAASPSRTSLSRKAAIPTDLPTPVSPISHLLFDQSDTSKFTREENICTIPRERI